MQQAIDMLEGVIRDDASMRIAYPTLAMCYVQVGDRERASLADRRGIAGGR